MMICLANITALLTRLVHSKWTLLCHVQLLVIVFAVMLAGVQGGELLRNKLAESIESSAPVDEEMTAPHLRTIRRSTGFSPAHAACAAVVSIDLQLAPRVRAPHGSPGLAPSGHRLANNLCAPLLC